MCVGRGYEKRRVVFLSLSTLSKEKIDLYLEFYFLVKTKVVENCVSFLLVVFLTFLLSFDMSFLKVFDSMLLINEIMINSHVFCTGLFIIQLLFIKNKMCYNDLDRSY